MSRASRREGGAEPPAADAREVAARVLHRVADRGAFAMPALDAELTRAKLAPRDAALATEIVYGALRVLPALDAVLAPRLRRPLSEADPLTRAILRAAVYQLQHLGRVPARATVHAAVDLVRRLRSPQSGGFVNAVLRRVAEQRPESPAPPTRLVVPDWLEGLLRDSLSGERVDSLLEGGRDVPPLCLAVRDVARRPALADALGAQPGALSPHALLLRRAGDPRRLPGFEEGAFWVQEEGAQLVALAVGARPGERIADVCAGHGGKTLLMASAMVEAAGKDGAQGLPADAGVGSLTSIDVDERKLDHIPEQLARLGLDGSHVAAPGDCLEFAQEAIDLSVGVGGLAPAFDRVLVDAPCTGLGTLRRRPELMLRLQASDVPRMAELQARILHHAIQLVRPGGQVTYAVCSPTRAEGEGVAAAVEARHGHLVRLDAAEQLPGIKADSDGILRLGGWSGEGISVPDGYQVVSWRVGA